MGFYRFMVMGFVIAGLFCDVYASSRGQRLFKEGVGVVQSSFPSLLCARASSSVPVSSLRRLLTTGSYPKFLAPEAQQLLSETEQKIAPFAEVALDRYGKGVFAGKRVELRHVGPRDGEQSTHDAFKETAKDDTSLEAETKIAHGRFKRGQMLRGMGFSQVEVGTYGKTKLPSMRPSGKVLELLKDHYKSIGHAGFSFLTLTPDNLRAFFRHGGERAAIVVGATDDFNQRNLGQSTAKLISGMNDVLKDGLSGHAIDGRMHPVVDLYVSNAFPESAISKSNRKNLRQDIRYVMNAFKGHVHGMILSDTFGTATPRGVLRLLASLEKHKVVHMDGIGLHLHRRSDSMEIDSLIAALRYGVTSFDVGYHAENLGGCPAALDSSTHPTTPTKRKHLPNISDLMTVLTLERLGVHTGINIPALAKFNAELISKLSGR